MLKQTLTLQQINACYTTYMAEHLGIVFTALTDDTLEATMPVNNRTKQPFGFLHGGASVVLAETLGSLASYLSCQEGNRVAGIEVSASHVKAVNSGKVRGVCQAIRLGQHHHIWQVTIFDDNDQLCCHCRLTTSIATIK